MRVSLWGLLLALVLPAVADAEPEANPGVWFGGLRILPRGQFLDLDNGGLFDSATPFPGGAAELRGAAAIVDASEDAAFAAGAPQLSRKPWLRVTTAAGNRSWFQILQTEPAIVVSFLTRLGGSGDPLACPRAPFAVGRGYSIQLNFGAIEGAEGYRVERSDDGGTTYRALAVADGSPWLDSDAIENHRHLYRLSALDGQGRPGVPVTLAASTTSRGVVAREHELDAGSKSRIDLLTGAVGGAGWDLEVRGISDQGMVFRHSMQLFCVALPAGDEGLGSPWDVPWSGATRIAVGQTFLVPLRGAGVARCRLLPASPGSRATHLYCEAYADALMLPPPPRVDATPREEDVLLHVATEEPWYVNEVTSRDLLGGAASEVALREGVGADASARSGEVRRYEAVARDDSDRRGGTARLTVNLSAKAWIDGSDRIEVEQGYSFDLARIVPREEADLFLTLPVTGGPILSLVAPLGFHAVERGPSLEEIVGVLPDQLRTDHVLPLGEDGEAPLLLVLRTMSGAYVRVALRAAGGAIHMRFRLSPRTPRFGEEEATREVDGLLLR